MNAILSPRAQLMMSWAIFVGSIVAWPVTALTIFSAEMQGILGLSWFAIIWTAYGNIVTAQVNRDIDTGCQHTCERCTTEAP